MRDTNFSFKIFVANKCGMFVPMLPVRTSFPPITNGISTTFCFISLILFWRRNLSGLPCLYPKIGLGKFFVCTQFTLYSLAIPDILEKEEHLRTGKFRENIRKVTFSWGNFLGECSQELFFWVEIFLQIHENLFRLTQFIAKLRSIFSFLIVDHFV